MRAALYGGLTISQYIRMGLLACGLMTWHRLARLPVGCHADAGREAGAAGVVPRSLRGPRRPRPTPGSVATLPHAGGPVGRPWSAGGA